MAGVKYQVERRPISSTGKVYRGTKPGDYVSVLSNPENVLGANGTITAPKPLSSGSSAAASYVPVGSAVPKLDTGSSSSKIESHVVEVIGEPWLVHSTHFSVEAATEAAATLANALGAENVRIVKVITGTLEFKI